MKTCKVVAIGDAAIGKTCLLHVYVNNTFPTDYIPTVFNTTTVTAFFKEQPVKLELYDTAGQEDYEALRTLSYPKTDVFLVCFGINNPPSLANVQTKWAPEIRSEMTKRYEIFLVGLKADMRDNDDLKSSCVSTPQGQEVAQKIGAYKYLECSALTGMGIKEVFTEILKLCVHKRNQDCVLS